MTFAQRSLSCPCSELVNEAIKCCAAKGCLQLCLSLHATSLACDSTIEFIMLFAIQVLLCNSGCKAAW